MQIKVRIKIFS